MSGYAINLKYSDATQIYNHRDTEINWHDIFKLQKHITDYRDEFVKHRTKMKYSGNRKCGANKL